MFGHEITDDELIKDSNAKALPKMPFLLRMKTLLSTVKFCIDSRKVAKWTNDEMVEFNFDPDTVTSKQLFDSIWGETDVFLPYYEGHLKASMASQIYNGILYSFLVSNLANTDGK